MKNKEELIQLIRDIDSDCIFLDEDGQTVVTTEWMVGVLFACGFVATTLDAAVMQMCEYFDEHIGHKSIVGDIVTRSGWPDLKKVKQYLTRE